MKIPAISITRRFECWPSASSIAPSAIASRFPCIRCLEGGDSGDRTGFGGFNCHRSSPSKRLPGLRKSARCYCRCLSRCTATQEKVARSNANDFQARISNSSGFHLITNTNESRQEERRSRRGPNVQASRCSVWLRSPSLHVPDYPQEAENTHVRRETLHEHVHRCLDCGKEFPYDWQEMKIVAPDKHAA
jgi:hypothetical protein